MFQNTDIPQQPQATTPQQPTQSTLTYFDVNSILNADFEGLSISEVKEAHDTIMTALNQCIATLNFKPYAALLAKREQLLDSLL